MGTIHPTVGKGHCFKLIVFRYLTITATENTERSKGTIASHDSSGMGVDVVAGVGDIVNETVDKTAPS